MASFGVIQRTAGAWNYLNSHASTCPMVCCQLLAGASQKGFQQEHSHVAALLYHSLVICFQKWAYWERTRKSYLVFLFQKSYFITSAIVQYEGTYVLPFSSRVAKFWKEHKKPEILLWPLLENIICLMRVKHYLKYYPCHHVIPNIVDLKKLDMLGSILHLIKNNSWKRKARRNSYKSTNLGINLITFI